MESNGSNNYNNARRQFLGTIASGIAALGLSAIASPLSAHAGNYFANGGNDPDEWFKQIKGKHRIVFDVPQSNEIFPFAWPRIFLATNAATGTPEKDCSVVVVFRHLGIPYAMEDRLWAKYNFGEVFKANDPKTNKPSTRNPFWKPAQGAYNVPGIGVVPIGINELQESGVLFCACDMALTVYSGVVAEKMGLDPKEVKKDWVSGILPGVQVVPAGIWALNRAQEKGCSYIFAG
jgi:intracellular sulfur oxidation DsrE/DsrF family protein